MIDRLQIRIGNVITKILLLLFVQSFLLPYQTYSQTTDGLELIRSAPLNSYLLTRFNKQLSTYNLNTRLEFIQDWENFNIRLKENFNSTFIKSTEKSIRDEQLFALQNSYRFNERFSIGLGINSNIYCIKKNNSKEFMIYYLKPLKN